MGECFTDDRPKSNQGGNESLGLFANSREELQKYHAKIASATKTLFKNAISAMESLQGKGRDDALQVKDIDPRFRDVLVATLDIALQQFAAELEYAHKEYLKAFTDYLPEGNVLHEILDFSDIINGADSLKLKQEKDPSLDLERLEGETLTLPLITVEPEEEKANTSAAKKENETLSGENESETTRSDDEHTDNYEPDEYIESDHEEKKKKTKKNKRHKKCDICGKIFSSIGNMKKHIQRKHPETPISTQRKTRNSSSPSSKQPRKHKDPPLTVCVVCGKNYSSSSNLTKHMKTVHYRESIKKGGGPIDPDKVKKTPSKDARTKCDICGKSFSSNSNLSKHVREKHLQVTSNRTCLMCGKAFTTNLNLERHMARQHSVATPRSYTCKVCFMVFADSEEFTKHAKVHVDEEMHGKDLQCSMCDEKFEKRDALKNHYVYTHGQPVKRLSCTLCTKTFERPDVLKNHYVTAHQKETKYKCHECNICFVSNHKLELHTARIHTGERNYTCEFCAKAFFQYDTLKVHLVDRHGIKTDFYCDLCKKYFALRSMLLRHNRERHGEKRNFLCSDCGRSFNTQALLRQHSKKHAAKLSYQCKECNKQFRWYSSLQCHLATAHGQGRVHKCNECDLEFRTRDTLRYHQQRRHSSNPLQVYTCALCNTTCKVKSSMDRHMKRKHSEKMELGKTVSKTYAPNENKPPPEIPLPPEQKLRIPQSMENPQARTLIQSHPIENQIADILPMEAQMLGQPQPPPHQMTVESGVQMVGNPITIQPAAMTAMFNQPPPIHMPPSSHDNTNFAPTFTNLTSATPFYPFNMGHM